ncbi:MAG TPA: DsbC family protein [Burkholderiales bacterium]|nr:DsbC family protein [Burkholderiales bacterium]
MLKTFVICLLTAATLAAPAAGADETAVRQEFQVKFPDMKVETVNKMPFPGIYEVLFNGQVVYTDEKVTFLFTGNLFDLRSQPPRNLTQDRNNRMIASTLASSTDMAVKRVKGNGKRTLYTFEDPNCGFCKKLQGELVKLNDVTIYTFLLPIVAPPDSVEKSKAVWCSKDRGKAWDELMSKGTVPAAGAKNCDTPIAKSIELARRFGVNGTPAVYLVDGQHIGGYLPRDKIEQALNSVAPK